MFIDALLKVAAAQPFTVGGQVSGSSIDIGVLAAQRVVGIGSPMGFGVSVDVAASCTTVKLEVIMATDAALTAGIVVVAEETRLAADLPAGGLLFLVLPPDIPVAGALRFLGLRVTPAGGAATVTLSASLTARAMFSAPEKIYPKGYAIS